MASAKASNFSIDHIMGFTSKGKRTAISTANANVSSSTDSVGDLCPRPETYVNPYCNSSPFSQKLAVPPHPYLWETPYHSMLYDYTNGYFSYASFNYYPLDFGQGSFPDGTGTQAQFVYLPTMDNPRKRNRMRTVFTENQSQELEHLFGITEYPAVEAREKLAVKAGLSAETVRVWFKNRRARMKRQGIAKGRTSARVKGGKRDSAGNDEKTSL